MSRIIDTYGELLLKAIGTHLFYVLVSVLIGSILGLFLGILLSRFPKSQRKNPI